jgi:primosomal protein N' (replication factor Y)
MKDRQTPTIHAREVLRARGGVERFALITTGLVPSAEMIAAGAEVIEAGPSRPWSLIELVDRREDPPGSGVLSDRTKTAIAAAVKRRQGVFVFTHRRGYAPVFRCVACRELRTCGDCGAKVGQSGACPRCGAVLGICGKCGKDRFEPLGAGVERVAELVKRIVDPDSVGMGGEGRQVTVGSVRDLPLLERISLAVVADADGLILGTNYRAAEEALRSLARVAAVVGSGSGRRTIVQTSNPDHPALEALRRGEVLPFLEAELEQRAALGFPPVGDLIVLECRNCPEAAGRDLADRLPDAAILGPAETERGTRWLLQAKDLAGTRSELRKIAGEWRDGGASLRIDVDPIDL